MTENIMNLDRSLSDSPVVLVVGDLNDWQRSGREPPLMPGFHFAGYADVTAEMLDEIRPDVVLSALFGRDFDAMDVARKLSSLGFSGRYRALSLSLPDPGVIRREVSAVARGLDFDLFLLDRAGL